MLGKNLIKAAAAKAQPLYIEDTFQTWLYTGNGSTQTITNGIKLGPSTTLGKTHKNSFTQNQESQNFTFTAQPGDVLVIHVTAGVIAAANVGTVIITVNGTPVSTDSVYDSSLSYFYRIAVVPVSGSVTYSVAKGAASYLEVSAFTISPVTPGDIPSVSVGAGYALTASGSYTVNSFASNGYGIAINTSREVLTSSVGQYGIDVDSFNAQNLWATSVHVISGSGSAVPSFQLNNLGTAYNNPVIVLNVQDAGIDPIDDPGEGGMVWTKSRSTANNNWLYSTEQGTGEGKGLITNDIAGINLYPGYNNLSSFNPDGFSLGISTSGNQSNINGITYASWTFRKAEKFFDILTYTGTGSARTVAHNLGSVPGCIIVKRTDTTGDWQVYHRANTANPETDYLVLNSTAATADSNTRWNDTAPTSSEFTVGTEATVNASGGTYVAYLFAHDAGGFGDDQSKSVIKCGSYTGNGSTTGPVVDLGWEPQWVMVKNADGPYQWYIVDNMRGFSVTDQQFLAANLSNAELSGYDLIRPTSTGFSIHDTNPNYNQSGSTYIYIAIRRGPMKTPEDATEVFTTDSNPGASHTAPFTPDSAWLFYQPGYDDGTNAYPEVFDRLRGRSGLQPPNTRGENTGRPGTWDSMTTFSGILATGAWMFRRAPGFFDVVAYTGTGSARTVAHNLGVAPELMIVKKRNNSQNWIVYAEPQGPSKAGYLDLSGAFFSDSGNAWNNTAPTSTEFTVNSYSSVNSINDTYIAYLFATCLGVSKVGSYTGTGTTLQVDCGFASGARFVLIKRTDSSGDWYVWDTARGIVSGNDPYLLLNSTAAEVTGTDYIDPYSAGFEISSTAPAAINASGGSFIFLAIS